MTLEILGLGGGEQHQGDRGSRKEGTAKEPDTGGPVGLGSRREMGVYLHREERSFSKARGGEAWGGVRSGCRSESSSLLMPG